MFIESSDRINYTELARRVRMETTRLTVKDFPSEANVQSTDIRPPPIEAAAPSRSETVSARSSAPAIRALRKLLWGVLHVPAVLRRSIIAIHIAESLQSSVTQLRNTTQFTLDAVRAVSNEAIMKATMLASSQAAIQNDVQSLTVAVERAERIATEQMAMLRREVLFQQRRLTRVSSAKVDDTGSITPTLAVAGRHDSLYAAFEEMFRGSRDDIKERLRIYVPRLILSGAGQSEAPAVDIGCGRGEWLELLRDQGLTAYGIDSNAAMVERCSTLGFEARQADLLTHLQSLDDSSRSAVTAFHVVEHLPFDVMVDFFDEALRVLIPGGVLVIETPNPETMRVGATTFYNDPTHRNPLIPASLQFILEHRGYTEVEIVRLHPFTQGLLQERTDDAHLLNRVLFGPQDYAVIARRF